MRTEKRFHAVLISLLIFYSAILALAPSIASAVDVVLAWDRGTEETTGYKVYWGTSSRSYEFSADVGDNTEYTVTNLESGKDYYFTSIAYDADGNESEFSVEAVLSNLSNATQSGDSGGGGGCFIATAAFGSYLAPEVQTLRDFRDAFLMTNTLGRMFVETYYKYSPPIADFIRGNEILRSVTKWLLTPVVYTVKFPLASALLLIFASATMYRVRKRRQGKCKPDGSGLAITHLHDSRPGPIITNNKCLME